MEYYYDIILNFNDYPIHYYEWNEFDNLERFTKLPIIRVKNMQKFINYHATIKDIPEHVIISDGVTSIALELVNESVAYLSSMSYDDELSINEIAHDMEITELQVEFKEKRFIPLILREDIIMQKKILATLDTASNDLLKYMYYYLTNKCSNNLDKIKNYLKKDITSNFNEKYHDLYTIIL